MRSLTVAATALTLLAGVHLSNVPPAQAAAAAEPLVEFEMMTWLEVKQALAAGKTTALFYTGGTEQRGPQNVNGGHNLMGRPTVKEIALRLGNAIAMPVLPFSPTGVSADLPGSISLPPDLLGPVLERIAEDAVIIGFKHVILMGDSGGGQPDVYDGVAKKLDAKYSSQGKRVFFAGDVYRANMDFVNQIAAEGYPIGMHGALADTSLMLYLEPDGSWVRKDQLANALGDAPLPRGTKPDPNVKRINNGITGDARRSSKELGKRLFDMKVEAAVKEIQALVGSAK